MTWLRDRRPDIVGLQELKLLDGQFPTAEFESAGYRAITHGQKAQSGVAILSRMEAHVLQVGLPGQEALGSRLLTADVAGLQFTTVYVPSGQPKRYDLERKLAWLDTLVEHFAERHEPDGQAVLCGDFNIVPAALDSWNEDRLAHTVGYTEPERERLANLSEWGLIDLFRHQHPAKKAFSWWPYAADWFDRDQGLRLDFLLGTKTIAHRLVAAYVDRDYRKRVNGLTASDHAPVIADLN